MTGAKNRPGFSLIELLCAMVLLAAVGLTLTLLLKESLEAERLQTATYEKLQRCNALADQFRADVAQAETAPTKWQDYLADGETLILQMKQNGHLVYLLRDGKLERLVFENGAEEQRQLLLVPGMGVEFLRPAADGKLVRMRLTRLRDGEALPGQTLEIVATLGGDWR